MLLRTFSILEIEINNVSYVTILYPIHCSELNEKGIESFMKIPQIESKWNN